MDMGGTDMTGFRIAIEFAYVFAMWAVMMIGMMAPSAAPMILMYARVGRQGKCGTNTLTIPHPSRRVRHGALAVLGQCNWFEEHTDLASYAMCMASSAERAG
jgi:predicted metal-binding membrane protein